MKKSALLTVIAISLVFAAAPAGAQQPETTGELAPSKVECIQEQLSFDLVGLARQFTPVFVAAESIRLAEAICERTMAFEGPARDAISAVARNYSSVARNYSSVARAAH